jgi:ketosteroid isomerase-like protein
VDDRAVVEAFFRTLGVDGDVDGWLALLSDDVSVDTPFDANPDGRRFEGKAAVERRFADARRRMRALTFHDLDVLATADAERWVVTCRSTGEMGDGSPYANAYCWILRVRDGRVVGWTEYFDPQQVAAVRRPAPRS